MWRWVSLAVAALTFTGCATVRTVSFPTADDGIVYADVYGRGGTSVVLAHGARFTKESWSEQAPEIAAAGFRVIAIDFRGRGKSHGGPKSSPNDVQFDVLAAVRYARRTGAEKVYVVGASMGGWAAATAAAAASGEIDRLVLLASPAPEPEKLTGRKLFIVSRDDTRGDGVKRLSVIRKQFDRVPKPKELVVLDGHAHAQFIFKTPEGPRLMKEILKFLTAP